jgi:hypothetical protein
VPAERDSFYHVLRVFDDASHSADADDVARELTTTA